MSDASGSNSPLSPKMQELAKRPVIQAAANQARTIAANAGVDIGDPMASL